MVSSPSHLSLEDFRISVLEYSRGAEAVARNDASKDRISPTKKATV